MTKNYLLNIDVRDDYDITKLKEKLDICVDWLRIVPGCYFLRTTSDKEKLYTRFKSVLGDTSFFISQIDISNNNYIGWLPQKKWDWLKNYKNK